MTTWSIHNLDEKTEKRVRARAKKWGLSLNQTLKRLLAEAVGTHPRDRQDQGERFARFLGLWSEEEVAEFTDATRDFRRVDDEDWT